MSVVRFVIQEAVWNVNCYLAGLRHAVVGKQGWRMNARVVWIRYLPARKYVASCFIVACIVVKRHAMLGSVHLVWLKFHRSAVVAQLPELWSAIRL